MVISGINKCNMLMAKPSLLLLPAINVFKQPTYLTCFSFKPEGMKKMFLQQLLL